MEVHGYHPSNCIVEAGGDQELSHLCVQSKFKANLDQTLSQKGERKQAKRITTIREVGFSLPQVTLLGGVCGKQTLRHTSGHKVTTVQAVCGRPRSMFSLSGSQSLAFLLSKC